MKLLKLTACAFILLSIPLGADDPVSSSVRYNREIVRIFQRKCVACHMENGLAVPLETFQDVRPWTRSIREEILERRMPPWPAVTGVRPFVNEMNLTTREIAIITSWIDGGMPRGEPADLPARKPREVWQDGDPDLKLTLPVQSVPDGNRSHVRRITVSLRVASDRWLRGFDVAPGNRSALRSVFVFLHGNDGRDHWLGGWTPWHAMTHTPFDAAYRLPRNAVLTVELHYQAAEESSGPLQDSSTLGLYFQPRRPAAILSDLVVTASPAKSQDRRYRLNGETVLRDDVLIWALRPEHEGSIEVKAVKPDGAVEPLLWIKENRTDFQIPYVLREPLRLPRASRLVVTSYCDVCANASRAKVVVLTAPPRLN